MTSADQDGVFHIGGDLPVHRMGFGAMQLTGPGVWGPPLDPDNARAVLRRAVERGVDFIDTADVYGPGDNERLIREALSPYSPGLVIATKGGLLRSGPATRENPGMSMNGTEAHIRAAVEGSLRDLGVERIDLYQLHRVDPATPIEETMSVFRTLRDEGKIRHVGLSQVSVEEIERARAVVEIATVQNIYNLAVRNYADVLVHCEANGIAFIPFWPLHIESVAGSEVLARIAREADASPRQVALAWLLQTSPATILIPGTASVAHLEENLAACEVVLTDRHMRDLWALGGRRET
ncbi:MAG: putative oxidoreductase [Phenylobacterium sp.]|uniref:aldo/keto reductase n=1 Tax=Phenylobacterium sp. TaxID=1871053 RepID=UPI0026212570|nr:aldo/keto reductase [Phenylobacterium sp.]MDB5496002.1 putative oxidoreductase [Phenylobacterium sp.]